MCDTMVAMGDVTASGRIIFAKNSDREASEAQTIEQIPRQKHAPGQLLQCTYIQIPQVEETYAVLLARPFWMWGAEMGSNEFGLTIGNEAVFSKDSIVKEERLTGMDLLRLALERAKTAPEAVDVITDLLETYGQGGNGGHRHKLYYNNAFLIADPREVWALETVGQHWAARRIKSGVYAISNGLSIGKQWDKASQGLVNYAVGRGWCQGEDDFDFARCYTNQLITSLISAEQRQSRSTETLSRQAGKITVETMMAVLRDHGPAAENNSTWQPDGLLDPTLCAHASFGPVRSAGQTVGAMVSELNPERPVHWLTGASAPCTGIFKPFFVDVPLDLLVPSPTDHYDPEVRWWRHEKLHRAVLKDYANRLPLYKHQRDQLEAQFLAQTAQTLASAADLSAEAQTAKLRQFCHQTLLEADRATEQWYYRVSGNPIRQRPGWPYRRFWDALNRYAGMPAEVFHADERQTKAENLLIAAAVILLLFNIGLWLRRKLSV